MKQVTLFDVDNEPIVLKFKSKYQKWKYENGYCKADAYSDIRCANCKHLFMTCPSTRKYYKCELLGISACSATDVRLSNVCKNFESEGNNEN